jgi:hypothetical protein
MAIINMFVTPAMLRHSSFNLPDEDSDPNSIRNVRGLRYHINCRESNIGFGIDNHGKLFIAGKVNEKFAEEATEKGFEVMPFFKISINAHLVKFMSALSSAYTRSYVEKHDGYNMIKFHVDTNEQFFGNVRYEFSVFSSVENKASAVLKVIKYRRMGPGKLIPIGSFRQPLFRKALFQLIWILMATAKEKESFAYFSKVPSAERLSYKFSSIRKVEKSSASKKVLYGIASSEENGWKTEIGTFSLEKMKPIKTSLLERTDSVMLEISSAYRIMRGDWLPFVGNRIAVGPDNYMTDKYGEIDLEKEFLSGEKWASAAFFASIISDYRGA